MHYADAVSQAIRYIEERLTEELTAEEVAAVAGYSPYHFHRIFQSATRTSVAAYIRKRRLTHAAYELFRTERRIVEIAVRYRFESQEAFTRAFRKLFGLPPGRFRRQSDMKDTLFRAMEMKPLDDAGRRHLHGGFTLEPRIVVENDPRTLVGLEIKGVNSREIGRLWGEFRQRAAEIESRRSPMVHYALIELTGVQWEVSYTACVEVAAAGPIPEGMVSKTLSPTAYAVFTHNGTLERLPDTFQYIYGDWLPRSGRRRANEPEFARYDGRYLGPANEASAFDIYIPIESGEA